MSLNKVMLIGNVGKDPVIKSTQNGKKIANFSIATSEYWKNKNTGDMESQTQWHNIVVFNEGLVGLIEKAVFKGTRLYVEGALRNRQYQANDGSTKYVTEVVLQGYNSKIDILTPKNNDGGYNDNQAGSDNDVATNQNDYDNIDDDFNNIPF